MSISSIVLGVAVTPTLASIPHGVIYLIQYRLTLQATLQICRGIYNDGQSRQARFLRRSNLGKKLLGWEQAHSNVSAFPSPAFLTLPLPSCFFGMTESGISTTSCHACRAYDGVYLEVFRETPFCGGLLSSGNAAALDGCQMRSTP